jgi:hypothetical protein
MVPEAALHQGGTYIDATYFEQDMAQNDAAREKAAAEEANSAGNTPTGLPLELDLCPANVNGIDCYVDEAKGTLYDSDGDEVGVLDAGTGEVTVHITRHKGSPFMRLSNGTGAGKDDFGAKMPAVRERRAVPSDFHVNPFDQELRDSDSDVILGSSVHSDDDDDEHGGDGDAKEENRGGKVAGMLKKGGKKAGNVKEDAVVAVREGEADDRLDDAAADDNDDEEAKKKKKKTKKKEKKEKEKKQKDKQEVGWTVCFVAFLSPTKAC